jgi:glyoxylase I family protein
MEAMMTKPALPVVTGAHHAAFRCRNAEETRAFYEDVLGFPMAQALDIAEHPTTGEALRYMHVFFDIGGSPDGAPNYSAFFEVANEGGSAPPFEFKRQWGMDLHFAMGVADHGALDIWRERLTAQGIEVEGPIDHGVFSSIYFHDPNGYRLEFAASDLPQTERFVRDSRQAQAILQNWVINTG